MSYFSEWYCTFTPMPPEGAVFTPKEPPEGRFDRRTLIYSQINEGAIVARQQGTRGCCRTERRGEKVIFGKFMCCRAKPFVREDLLEKGWRLLSL